MKKSKGLSPRQQEILKYIESHVESKGYPPSVREIGARIGLKSSATVHAHLKGLEKKGFIRRDPTKPRAIELLVKSRSTDRQPAPSANYAPVPLVGQITAGQPILAVENVEEVFSLPKELIGADDAFMLRVRGESMIDAGINDGDYVIVRPQSSADNGDIVVALLEDEATIKRFYREPDRIRLQPENPSMEPIYAKEVSILGKVTGLFRTL